MQNPFSLELETVIAASPLLGHFLEDRKPVRDAQDQELARRMYEGTATPLANSAQRRLFAVAPLDVLVSNGPQGKQFHLIELNGTGIGGLSNLPGSVVGPILGVLRDMASLIPEEHPLVVLGVSGKESDENPRLNKVMQEKLLFAEALAKGLRDRHGRGEIFALPSVKRGHRGFDRGVPGVALGYMKELIAAMRVDDDGRLWLGERRVSAMLNDRFILNTLEHFEERVDLRRLFTINRCFLPGADKGFAYRLMNEYIADNPSAQLPDRVGFEIVHDRATLVETVLAWVRDGRQVVIKPHATGGGHGVDFFLKPEPEDVMVDRIDDSLRLTKSHYGTSEGAFPYTVCDFIDACVIERPDHPLASHKYELRIVVYQDDGLLRAFPSIVKVASSRYEADKPARDALINNVTAATERGAEGTDFMLPLTHPRTLEVLGIEFDELLEISAYLTRFVAHTIDRMQRAPELFGLPGDDFQGKLFAATAAE
jgi:hypothetical protein